MEEIRRLTERRNKIIAEMKQMLDTLEGEQRADFTEEEEAKYTQLSKDCDGLKKQIDRRTEQRALEMADDGATGEGETHGEQRAQKNAQAQMEERAFAGLIRGEHASEEEKQARANMPATGANGSTAIGQSIINRVIREAENICPIFEGANKFHFKGTVKFPVADETGGTTVVAYVDDEFTDIGSTSAALTSVDLSGYLFGALTKVSRTLIGNSDIDIVGFVITQLAIGFARFAEKELLKGTASKMTGLLSSTNTVSAGAAAALTADDLVNLIHKVPQVFRGACRFVMNNDTLAKVRKLKDGENRYIFLNDATNGFEDRLLGFPVDISDQLDNVAASKKPILFCDYSGLYVNIRENIGVMVERPAKQHSDHISLWGEMDSKIVEKQKVAVLVTPAS